MARLAKAKVDSQINFGERTVFLSADDVSIATQLKGIYGNDVPAALASSEASALRLNTTFKGLSSGVENDLVSGLTDIADGAKTAGQGFSDLGAVVEKSIEQMIIKITIVEPLMRSLQSAMSASGLFRFLSPGTSALPGTAGGAFYGPPAPSAFGNVFASGRIVPFANGGVPDLVSSPTLAPMALFGEAGEEAIIPLRRGADGRLGVASSGGGGGPNVIIHNHTDAQAQVQKAPNGDLTITLKRAMDAAAGDSAANGSVRRVLESQFGVKPFMGQ